MKKETQGTLRAGDEIAPYTPNGEAEPRQEKSRALTPKQQRAVAICASSFTVHEGVQQCIAEGVCAEETFYATWWRQSHFVEALNSAREKALGDVAERCRNRAIARADDYLEEIDKIARGKKSNQVQLAALQYMLDKAGVESIGKSQRKNLLALIAIRITESRPSKAMEVAVQEIPE